MRKLLLTIKGLSSKRPALWIGFPLSVAVGFVFFVATARFIEADARQRFLAHAHNARSTIVARIKSYTEVARGTASMLQSIHPASRSQFHAYVTGLNLPHHFPAIETLNFGEYVLDEDREKFETRMRKEAMPDGLPAPPFLILPPGRRPNYSVTTFIEPITGRFHLIGWDLQITAGTQPFYDAMRDQGLTVTSGIPIMKLSGKNRTVLAMRVPAFLPNLPLRTIHERRRAFIGSVGMAFSLHTLLLGVIDEMPVKNARMILVAKGIDPKILPGGILFDTTGGKPTKPRFGRYFSERFTQTLPVDFNGRPWDVTFSADPHDMYSGFEEFMPWLAMLAGFISAVLLYALFHALTSSRRRAIKLAKGMTRELRESQAKLQLSHLNLRRLAAHADQIKEGERKRIAREIHDDLGQNLLALRIDADMLANRTRAQHSRLHERACATLFHIDVTIKSVRQIINDLRPNVLDLGLSAAVEWQIAEFKRRTGIDCELLDDSTDLVLDERAATAFFRILQESLSNIVRHAQASRVRVALRSSNHSLSMTVSDDGIGIGILAARKAGSFGLVGIEERISILNGTFSIDSNVGEGTTVSVSVPLGPPINTVVSRGTIEDESKELFLHSSELS